MANQTTTAVQSVPQSNGISHQKGARRMLVSSEAIQRTSLEYTRSFAGHDVYAFTLHMKRVRVKKKGPCGLEKKREL